jgi:hypothetical protein
MTRLTTILASFSCSLVAMVVAVVCLPATTASAQTSQPAADSPKGVLLAYTKALTDGDGPAVRKLLLTTSPTDEKMVNAMVETQTDMSSLSKAAASRFGDEAAHATFGDPAVAATMENDILSKATETITGDTATVTANQSHQGTMMLKKVDGQWKIVVADMAKGVNPENLDKLLQDIDKSNLIMKQMAADIAAGKYTNAEAARSALDEKIAPVKAEQKADQKAAAASATTKPM